MEIKDWILLLVPILFNGIMIFGIQKRMEEVFSERTIKQHRKLEAEETFWAQTLAVKRACVSLMGGQEEFQVAYKKLHHETVLLYELYGTNEVILSPYSDSVSQIQDCVNNILDICHQAGKRLSEKDAASVTDELHKLLDVLNSLIHQML